MLAATLLPLCLAFAAQVPAEESGLAERYGERWTTEARVYYSAGPSVVRVDVFRKTLSTALPNPADLLAHLGPPIGQGSGVVINAKGFVITNAHVVQPDARLSAKDLIITLAFGEDFGGKQVLARVLNVDLEWDLALLKIDESGPFPAIPLAESDDLLIGEKVIAIGTAYGNSHSITSGILSGIQRDVQMLATNGSQAQLLSGLLQTDAAINPGNSGGPLMNAHGELIGINSATLTYADGIGYAIPVGRVRDILETRLFRPSVWLGASLSGEGALTVAAVHPRGPANQSGLMPGDRIVAVNSVSVLNAEEFRQELILLDSGSNVTIDYERADRRRVTEIQLMSARQRDTFGVLGFICDPKPYSMVIRDASGWPTQYPVLRLSGVFEGTGAARLGLKAGDSLIAVHLLNQPEGDGWVPVSSEQHLLNMIHGPDFDFRGLNIWWHDGEGKSHKGRLSFDDPDLSARGAIE
ncbi:MAG: S1C family serine protease [Planctomycetota bacterium]